MKPSITPPPAVPGKCHRFENRFHRAGNCMLSVFEQDGRYILIGTFGCETRADRFHSCLEIYDALYA